MNLFCSPERKVSATYCFATFSRYITSVLFYCIKVLLLHRFALKWCIGGGKSVLQLEEFL